MELPFKVAAYDGRTDFPSHITHRDITTKPEDQGSYGTCAMWTSTTVVEMIIWKLTGRYLEFSDDEIYNIYLDCQAGYRAYKLSQYSSSSEKTQLVTSANSRKCMRKSVTEWEIPDELDNGETFFINQHGQVLGDDAIPATMMSPWYNIYHYNDPDHRKNHYPDKFSEICFIAKNYIFNSIYRTYNTTGVNYKEDQSSPSELMHWAFCSNFPLKCGIPGHAVAFYDIDQKDKHVDFNSSWNSEEVCQLRFPYSTTKPYYGTCTDICTGKTDTRFDGGLYQIEYFDRKLDANGGVKTLKVIQNDNIDVVGTSDIDMFKTGTEVQLSAIPAEGFHFSKWSDGNIDNPRIVKMTSDIELCAIASNIVNTSLQHTMTVIQNDMYEVTGVVDQQIVSNGTTLTVECKCKGDATFVEWNIGSTSNPMTLTVDSDITIFPIVQANTSIANVKINQDNYLIGSAYPTGFGSIYSYTDVFGDDSRQLLKGFDCDMTVLKEDVWKSGATYKLQATGKNDYSGTAVATTTLKRGLICRVYVCVNESTIISNADKICKFTLKNAITGSTISTYYNLLSASDRTINPSTSQLYRVYSGPSYYTSDIYTDECSQLQFNISFTDSSYTADRICVIQTANMFTKISEMKSIDGSTATLGLTIPSESDKCKYIVGIIFATQDTSFSLKAASDAKKKRTTGKTNK